VDYKIERDTRLIAQMSRSKYVREGLEPFVAKRRPGFLGE